MTQTKTVATHQAPPAEAVPTTWDDARDSTFFRLTAGALPPELTYGASVLLSSYDED
jgi:hypothetical protein